MGRWREACGQATSEYVALVALVAVVLALAAGLTSGGIGGQLLAGVQRALCEVAGAACGPPPAAADELVPCPLERSVSSESLDGAFELVRLGGGSSLSAVRGSDGRVTVTLATATHGGGALGLGAAFGIGAHQGAELSAQALSAGVSSRSWTLPSVAAARAFVDRYGSKATLVGRAVDAVRSGCSILCDALGWHPHAELPPPDEVELRSGVAATLSASLGPAGAHMSNGSLIGARLRRDGGSTWFLQLDAAAGAELSLGGAALATGTRRESVAAFTLDAHDRLTQLAIDTLVGDHAGAAIGGGRGPATARLGATDGHVTELDATLDLRSARERVVAAGLATALRGSSGAAELQRRVRAVSALIDRYAVIDRRTYALSRSSFDLGAAVSLGTRIGGAFTRTREGMRLLGAETRLPGLPFLPRDDCRSA